MEVTFAMDNAVGNSQRKRTYRACESCKRRKKRCTHDAVPGLTAPKTKLLRTRESEGMDMVGQAVTDTGAALRSPSSNVPQPDGESVGGGNPSQESASRESSPVQSPRRALASDRPLPQSHRFVGDLNPETVFYTQADSDRTNGLNQNDVGMWVVRSKDEPQPPIDAIDGPLASHTQAITETTRLRDKAHFDSDVSTEQLLPPQEDQSHLINIYFSKIHPLLPLLDESSFRKGFSERSVPTVLVKALCLAASKDPAAKLHLRLGKLTSPLPPAQFAHRVHVNLSHILNTKKRIGRVTMIRCFALMSLHSEGSESSELASLNLMQAIHHTHTIGIHFGREKVNKQDGSLTSLFWVLWSLDRLNAAINGRPVMMHDRDIGLKIHDVIPILDAPFRICLRLSQHLDSVIELYRPAASSSSEFPEKDIPSFEEVVDECRGWEIQRGILASLETFYHAISILSCRLRRSNRQYNSHASYLRQCNSARQIVFITQQKSNGYLAPLPVIPYAVSLSLSVAYMQLRQSRLNTTRESAKDQVTMCAEVLENLSSRWWSASTMAKLARKALLELDKAANESGKGARSALLSSSLQAQRTSNREQMDLDKLSSADQEQPSQVHLGQYNQESGLNNQPHVEANGVVDKSPPMVVDTTQREYPFDFHASYSTQDFTTNQAEIENIDAFLGNFLDLQSSRTNENSSFLEYMDSLSQDYFMEMTQLPDPSANSGS